MKTKTKIIPLLINVNGKEIGIEYKKGKFVLFGKEYMDEGVEMFLTCVGEKLQVDRLIKIAKKKV